MLTFKNGQNEVVFFFYSLVQFFIVIMQVHFALNITIDFNSQIKSLPRIAISFKLEFLVEM